MPPIYPDVEPEPYKPPEGYKMCSQCRVEMPADLNFFDGDADKKDGLKGACKKCRKEYRELQEFRSIGEEIKKLDMSLLKTLERSAMAGGSDVPHIAEMLQGIIGLFGGTQGVAMQFMGTYLQSDVNQRIRMLQSVMKLTKEVTETGAAKVPVELMSDEDIQRELEKRSVKLKGPVVFDPPAKKPEPIDDLPSDDPIE